ncbi:MAG TPA: DMT family transporter [Candidatus Marinimicrobia bacterium]|nr:DMT family transporter [Candidatus Neomarinimicrobiota bacterium]
MDIRSFLMGISIAFMWASAFTAARILMINAPPFLVLSSRFFISGLLAITIARCFGQKIDFSRREWYTILSIGLCQNTVCTALNFTAMQWVTASIAAIIASMLPIIIAMFAWIFQGEEIGVIGKLGLFTAIAGVFLIVYDKTADETKILGLVLCIVAVLGFAGAALIVGNSLKNNKNLFMIVGLQMIVGSVTLLPLSILFETWTIKFSSIFIISFAYLILIPGLIGTLVWFSLLIRIGGTKASAFHFLNPFFGVAIASVILSEPLTSRDWIGVAIISVGILAVQHSKRIV